MFSFSGFVEEMNVICGYLVQLSIQNYNIGIVALWLVELSEKKQPFIGSGVLNLRGLLW